MTRETAARICARINEGEVALPGVVSATLLQLAGADWAVLLRGRGGDRGVVSTVAHYQKLANWGPVFVSPHTRQAVRATTE